ncbi:MAG: type II toxin-antitoxin system HicA family toxin [Chloroflexi bacterium]|nr:MAG: type II toxin-antitoxin system HicA family toxin [Chloroflexota bacterium]
MVKLPRARAEKHVRAFQRDGWTVARVTGSHYILTKEGCDYQLSIPYHRGRTVKVGLLKGLIRDAGLTNEEYLNLFYGKRRQKR